MLSAAADCTLRSWDLGSGTYISYMYMYRSWDLGAGVGVCLLPRSMGLSHEPVVQTCAYRRAVAAAAACARLRHRRAPSAVRPHRHPCRQRPLPGHVWPAGHGPILPTPALTLIPNPSRPRHTHTPHPTPHTPHPTNPHPTPRTPHPARPRRRSAPSCARAARYSLSRSWATRPCATATAGTWAAVVRRLRPQHRTPACTPSHVQSPHVHVMYASSSCAKPVSMRHRIHAQACLTARARTLSPRSLSTRAARMPSPPREVCEP